MKAETLMWLIRRQHQSFKGTTRVNGEVNKGAIEIVPATDTRTQSIHNATSLHKFAILPYALKA